MPLINCEISLDVTCSEKYVISSTVGTAELKIKDSKLYVPIVTSSTEDNVKLLKYLESVFKRTINWIKCNTKSKTFPQNRYLNYLIHPSFQGINRLFVLPFQNETDK